ncbi:hypothetical protein J4450_05450 [Candidatus Micrarchaeota archaeon]|nr:hypothetical protein [Candidatus Micrarchaeota archaeon]
MAFQEIILDLLSLGTYAVTLMLGITLTKKLYGGKFTSALPYLLAAIFLIFFVNILNIFIFFWFPTTATTQVLKASIQIIVIIAGVMLLMASYKIYLLKYATTGFLKKIRHGEEE